MRKIFSTKFIYIIYLFSFYLYTYGKFIVIISTIYFLIKKALTINIDKGLFKAYKYFFIILLIFLLSFLSAVLQDNDILQIIRNNFYTIIFILVGINITYMYNNFNKFMIDTIKIVGILAMIQIVVYIVSIINLPFHLFVNDILSSKIGYTIGFAGLGMGNESFGMKMVTNMTSIYLFLIPYVFFFNKQLKPYIFPIILVIILSGSMTQYSILLFYIIIYYIKLINKPVIFLKKLFAWKNLLVVISVIYFIIQSGLGNVIINKIDNFVNLSDNGQLTSSSIRVIQAKIMLEEFSESYLIGKGLGYDSKKYDKIRNEINGNKQIKYFNYSMYENQYLDILMKFGLIGALCIYILYFFYPIVILIKKNLSVEHNLYFSISIGYLGMTIFAGSNGNAFYSYVTMFIWGVVIYLISSQRVRRII